MDIAPADAKLVPISADHFASVAEFLHKEMNSKVSIDQWQRVIAANWSSDAPNHGFMLHHEAVGVVGVLCAIYAHVVIDGEIRNVCNPHTWCVLDAFRKRSIELVVAVIKQPDWHFSMLSPNAEGEQIFSFLKFKPVSRATRLFPCGLWLTPFSSGRRVVSGEDLESSLDGDARRVYLDHRGFEWLNFLSVSDGERACLVIYRTSTIKRLSAAAVLYVSDPDLFAASMGAICTHLQVHRQAWSVLVEQRVLGDWAPARSLVGPEAHPKFFLSNELAPDLVPNIYSELVALNA